MASGKRGGLEPGPVSGRVKSTITSRLRENEGKFIRQLEQKDQEILSLRKKLVELSNAQKRNVAKLGSGFSLQNKRKWDQAQAAKLEASLRTVSNEKLQLERKLQMASKSIEDLKTNPHLNEEMLKVAKHIFYLLLHFRAFPSIAFMG